MSYTYKLPCSLPTLFPALPKSCVLHCAMHEKGLHAYSPVLGIYNCGTGSDMHGIQLYTKTEKLKLTSKTYSISTCNNPPSHYPSSSRDSGSINNTRVFRDI